MMALSFVKGVGPVTAKTLVSNVGSAEGVFCEKKDLLLKIPNIGAVTVESICNSTEVLVRVDEELRFIEKYGVVPIVYTDQQRYPSRLYQCDDGPIVIYCKGTADLNRVKVLSVVGTRMPSDNGKMICERIISDLAANHPDMVVVSGLAYGIDVCAHRAAIKAGIATAAVVAHGLDMVYPAVHREVACQILNNGVILTEYPSKTKPEAPNFVSRNRIVAGLSAATLVIESGEKGGSLITARMANMYNREVMAIPNAPGVERSKGCNDLIKYHQATLVESAQDIEESLDWASPKKGEMARQGVLFAEPQNDTERKIYQALLADSELSVGQLSQRCSLSMAVVNSSLLNMEFNGLVKCLPGNIYKILV